MPKSTPDSLNKRTGLYLPDAETAIVLDILGRYAPGRAVTVFGSRATGKNLKPYSDLDLCIMGDMPLTLAQNASLEDAFSESDLPIKVDIADWAATDESFRRIIMQQALPLIE